MSVESMISDGLYLMLIGMGFVVSFLTLLVIILNIMEKVIVHEEIESVTYAQDAKMDNSTLTAVISAAVHQHRRRNRN